MTETGIIAILVALIPAYFGWKEYRKQHELKEEENKREKESLASSEWKKLYELVYKEKKDLRAKLNEIQDEFSEMKTDSMQIRIEFNNFKKSMKNKYDDCMEENQKLKEENTILRGQIKYYEEEIERLKTNEGR